MEMKDAASALGNSRPLILPFGDRAYELVGNHSRPEEYSRLVRLPHYSRRINKEAYKAMVLTEIAAQKNDERKGIAP
jgi:hypothetical protein